MTWLQRDNLRFQIGFTDEGQFSGIPPVGVGAPGGAFSRCPLRGRTALCLVFVSVAALAGPLLPGLGPLRAAHAGGRVVCNSP
jgi:hypothetical protein